MVRHPQYLPFFVLAFALALIGRRWVIIPLGTVGSVAFSFGLGGADQGNIEKLGDEYRRYEGKVPGYSILLGLRRRLARPQGPVVPADVQGDVSCGVPCVVTADVP